MLQTFHLEKIKISKNIFALFSYFRKIRKSKNKKNIFKNPKHILRWLSA